MKLRRATITAVGHYVPEKVLTNADLERMVDTSDEWIRKRTGISERRILENGVTSDLAVKAIQQVLARLANEQSADPDPVSQVPGLQQ